MINGLISKLNVCTQVMKKYFIVRVMYKYYAIFSLVLFWTNSFLLIDPKWKQIKVMDQATWLEHNTPEGKHLNYK